jgi:hypothetical protein
MRSQNSVSRRDIVPSTVTKPVMSAAEKAIAGNEGQRRQTGVEIGIQVFHPRVRLHQHHVKLTSTTLADFERHGIPKSVFL